MLQALVAFFSNPVLLGISSHIVDIARLLPFSQFSHSVIVHCSMKQQENCCCRCRQRNLSLLKCVAGFTQHFILHTFTIVSLPSNNNNIRHLLIFLFFLFCVHCPHIIFRQKYNLRECTSVFILNIAEHYRQRNSDRSYGCKFAQYETSYPQISH